MVVGGGAGVVDGGGGGRPEWLMPADRGSGARHRVPAAGSSVLIGAHPRTGSLPGGLARERWGDVMTGADLSEAWPPVGALRHRPMKRVASAVGDVANVVARVHELTEAAPKQGSGGWRRRDRPSRGDSQLPVQ